MNGQSPNRVVILSGSDLVQRHTCATLIQRGVNVVGICYAGRRMAGVPLDFLRMSTKRKGWRRTLSEVTCACGVGHGPGDALSPEWFQPG